MLGLWTGAAGGSSGDTERLVLFQLPSMLPAPPMVRPPPSAAVKTEPGGSGAASRRTYRRLHPSCPKPLRGSHLWGWRLSRPGTPLMGC